MEETLNRNWLERPGPEQDVDDLIFAGETCWVSER